MGSSIALNTGFFYPIDKRTVWEYDAPEYVHSNTRRLAMCQLSKVEIGQLALISKEVSNELWKKMYAGEVGFTPYAQALEQDSKDLAAKFRSR